MGLYNDLDYISNKPLFLPNIGNIKCPTLRDISRVSYSVFCCYINILSLSLDDFNTKNNTKVLSVFPCLLQDDLELLNNFIQFFAFDEIEFDASSCSFTFFSMKNGTKIIHGKLDYNNFEFFRQELRCILGLKEPTKVEFQNDLAKKKYEKLMKAPNLQNVKQDSDNELDNLILKFCTHNKTAINILNVWDMTYYQFTKMFSEYCRARHYDFNDMMAANSFNFKKSSDYKPMEFLNKFD